jgi:ligand-binding sensor domain-containing protein/signal transduction histidine kinase
MLGMRTFAAWRRPALWLLLAACCCGAEGATSRSLRFEHLGVEQGLSQESVLNILQDRQGFMWFGTQAGLSRFDGHRMTVFKNDPADPASLPDNYVSSSFEDAQGRLWFGTKGGLARFDRDTQKFIRYSDGASAAAAAPGNRSVVAIAAERSGALWLASGDGLKRFDPDSGSLKVMRHDPARADSLSDNRVSALVFDTAGVLWVGTGAGLDRLAPGAAGFQHYRLGGPDEARRNSVLALSIGKDGALWIGSAGGLETWRVHGAQIERRRVGSADGMPAAHILSLYHDHQDNLWVGTDRDGLLWRNPDSGRFAGYRHQALDRHSLSDNQVAATFVDGSGTLWVGSWFGGVSRADLASGGFRRTTHSADDADSISANKVRAMTGGGHGRLWLGTTGGGLNLFDPASGKVRRIVHDPARRGSLPDNMLTALAMQGERLWVGSPSGLSWRDPASGSFTPMVLGTEPDANYIQRLLADRQGDLWVLTRGGLHRIDRAGRHAGSWVSDPRDPHSLGDNFGFALLEDSRGAFWIGTNNGIDRFDRASGRFTHFRHDPADPVSLRHSRIYYLFESGKGELWAGTAGGLHRIETGADGKLRFRFFAISSARAADPIGGILEDASGALWISTTAGISRLDPATGRFKSYTAKDGLVDGSYFVGSAYGTQDGRMYFGGVNGMTSFDPRDIKENPVPPRVVITDFLIFNQPVRAGQLLAGAIQDARAITLSHRDSVLSLEFAALHYADPQRNRYAYQLEGFDQDWVDTDAGKRFATYTNLDPGHYVFRVKASNKDGVWSETPTALEITITPPLWKTWWFRLLVAMLALGGAYALLRVRIHALVQQKTLLGQQVSARTAELMLQKESVERQKREVEHQKEVVELAHRNISLLSEIGRKLTAKLDSESIMTMLYENVNELMDASVFGIGVYRPEREMIEYPFAIERGKRYAPYSRSMREPNQLAVWCIVNEREVFINNLEAEYRNFIDVLTFTCGPEHMGTLDDGSLPEAPVSLLYVPISVNGRMLGVVTVHSYQQNAYKQIHLDMLRTLASYVGIAFDNADAYRQLKSTQAQLVAQEKLAALGSLVAGVAHELNTPIGNSVLMASTLQEKTSAMARSFAGGGMRRSELAGYIEASEEASALIMRSLLNAADLVNSFKQVAVDQASAQRRRFCLEQAIHEIVATMMNQVRKAGHALEVAVPGDIVMDSFPGPLGQVIINFINNALLHAFDQPGGQMRLDVEALALGRVRIAFHDNGKGIPVEHQARIFDPFFTTKMGQGGSGLGLNITYNIVTSLLGGHVWVESGPGGGTTFYLDLSLAAPPMAHE